MCKNVSTKHINRRSLVIKLTGGTTHWWMIFHYFAAWMCVLRVLSHTSQHKYSLVRAVHHGHIMLFPLTYRLLMASPACVEIVT